MAPAVRPPPMAPPLTAPRPSAQPLPLPAPPLPAAPAPAPRRVAPPAPSPTAATPQVAPPPAPAPEQQRAPGRSRWATFAELGLGKPAEKPAQQLSQRTAKLMVSAYRLLGFGILTIIVVVLIGYIATSAFYFVSDSWIEPMVVSKTDEHVLSLQSQLAGEENERDRLLAELHHADRYIEVQQTFQGQFAEAIRADLEGRKSALKRMKDLAQEYAGARERIQSSNSAFAKASRRRMSREYRAGLIDRSDMLSGKYQLAQITSSNLSLAEREAEYQTRAADLQKQAQSLDAILTEKGGEGVLSYEVLHIKQEYELSRLDTAKAIENRKMLKASLEREQSMIDSLQKSPYLRALADDASVAFVPYSNMDNVSIGAPVYRCALEMIFCSKVGKVVEIMPGEVSFKHPHRDKMLRGQMVSVDVDDDDAAAAEEDVLFVGGRPLFL